jgi:hypothetical protein
MAQFHTPNWVPFPESKVNSATRIVFRCKTCGRMVTGDREAYRSGRWRPPTDKKHS